LQGEKLKFFNNETGGRLRNEDDIHHEEERLFGMHP